MQTDRPSGGEPGSRTKADGGSARQPADLADITELLRAWRHGVEEAFSRLLPLVYDELRRRARRHLGAEARGHLLQPTALVHETSARWRSSSPMPSSSSTAGRSS